MQRPRPAMLRHGRRSLRGFTLVELLVVITILAILASILTVGVMFALKEAHISETQMKINTLGAALEDFQRRFGKYPDDGGADNALDSAKALYKNLKTPPKGAPWNFEDENFEIADTDNSGEKAIVDSWKTPIWYMIASQYQYVDPNRKSFRLVSAGPDRSFDDGDDDNIFNWKFDDAEDSPNHKKQIR